jgi:hypothetical protein
MHRFVILAVVAAVVATPIAGCWQRRVPLTVAPEPPEGHFIRACELLAAAAQPDSRPARLRDQARTMAALRAIRPPGRFCFVCRRLRRCTAQAERLGLAPSMNAHQLARAAVVQLGLEPGAGLGLPPPGGPDLDTARERLCRACASMPERIQRGTWSRRRGETDNGPAPPWLRRPIDGPGRSPYTQDRS